jgi:glycine/D-amino acid oxidase-like deaminating enzyme
MRKLEVTDRCTLAQEFRIGGHHHVGRRIGFMDQPLDFVPGADRHRRFGDHNGEALERRCDFARRGMNVAQIGMAVAASRRRADGNEHRVGRRDRCSQIGGKIQPPGLHIGSHQRIEAGLENRDFAPAQAGDLVAVLVHTGDLVTEIRETGA